MLAAHSSWVLDPILVIDKLAQWALWDIDRQCLEPQTLLIVGLGILQSPTSILHVIPGWFADVSYASSTIERTCILLFSLSFGIISHLPSVAKYYSTGNNNDPKTSQVTLPEWWVHSCFSKCCIAGTLASSAKVRTCLIYVRDPLSSENVSTLNLILYALWWNLQTIFSFLHN